MATAAFTAHKADAFLEPLLTYVDDDDSVVSADRAHDAVAGGAGAATPSPLERLKAAAIQLVLAGGAALAVGAMVMAPVAAVFVMAGMAVAHAPYVAYKEHRIAKLPGESPRALECGTRPRPFSRCPRPADATRAAQPCAP
jgi:hypothetical protein